MAGGSCLYAASLPLLVALIHAEFCFSLTVLLCSLIPHALHYISRIISYLTFSLPLLVALIHTGFWFSLTVLLCSSIPHALYYISRIISHLTLVMGPEVLKNLWSKE